MACGRRDAFDPDPRLQTSIPFNRINGFIRFSRGENRSTANAYCQQIHGSLSVFAHVRLCDFGEKQELSDIMMDHCFWTLSGSGIRLWVRKWCLGFTPFAFTGFLKQELRGSGLSSSRVFGRSILKLKVGDSLRFHPYQHRTPAQQNASQSQAGLLCEPPDRGKTAISTPISPCKAPKLVPNRWPCDRSKCLSGHPEANLGCFCALRADQHD